MGNQLGKAKKGRGKSFHTHRHRSPFGTIVAEVLREADILIQVLDARDIENSRNLEVEEHVKKSGKALIYVFNKSDLIDKNKVVMEEELEDFRPYLFFSVTERRGSSTLRKMIRMQAKKIEKDAVNVGVIGYPNTGKSSIINYLTGSSSAGTSPEAGHTRGIQKVKLSEGLYLIDTPGVIHLERKSRDNIKFRKHTQIGTSTWSKARQPDMIVNALISENPGALEKYYGFSENGDVEKLIEFVGKKLHYMKKGGEVDETRTAKKILRDWQEGKIKD